MQDRKITDVQKNDLVAIADKNGLHVSDFTTSSDHREFKIQCKKIDCYFKVIGTVTKFSKYYFEYVKINGIQCVGAASKWDVVLANFDRWAEELKEDELSAIMDGM